ncbi:MAG: PLP-dependent aminotransferase family protein [Pseudolabrys sp.]|nr:PLP-dependent aminotransferase family protein [Pseudolabrys sp.]
MADWLPNSYDGTGPRYLQIVAALAQDISRGMLLPGTRLLPHRDMAERLGLSVGTVSKAYDEAEKRGLISGEVGRGTFVLGTPPTAKLVAGDGRARRLNLALNTPPSTGEDALIAQALRTIADSHDLADLLRYLPHQGGERHRATIAGWLSGQGMPASADSLFVTHGAQHAISLAIGLLAGPGETVLAENLTYSGIRALANHEDYRLRGVAMDERGLIPEQLDRAFSETGARVVYCMPTLQTPTGSTMPAERRDDIIEIVRKHDAFLVEDDAYGFLCDPPMPPLSARMPERSFYVVSFAKCLAPGLRIGALVAPPAFRDRCINGLRSTGWMATPIMAEVVGQLIETGRLDDQLRRKREAAVRRHALAQKILGEHLPLKAVTPAFHIWLQMPAGRTTASLIAQAAMTGVTIAPPDALQSFDPMSNGVRLCLGAPETESDVEFALQAVANILDSAETMSFV